MRQNPTCPMLRQQRMLLWNDTRSYVEPDCSLSCKRVSMAVRTRNGASCSSLATAEEAICLGLCTGDICVKSALALALMP